MHFVHGRRVNARDFELTHQMVADQVALFRRILVPGWFWRSTHLSGIHYTSAHIYFLSRLHPR
jgi:hypothetical protein